MEPLRPTDKPSRLSRRCVRISGCIGVLLLLSLVVLLLFVLLELATRTRKPEPVSNRAELKKPVEPALATKRPKDEHCNRFFTDHYFAEAESKSPVTVSDEVDEKLDASCRALRSRGFYSPKPLSKEEADFPIAYIRLVHKHYHLQELFLNLMYAPQNHYCFIVDSEALPQFRMKIEDLSYCFRNVQYSALQFRLDESKHNMMNSYVHCMKVLLSKPGWKYVVLTENYDMPLKTNLEMVRILTALGGANDVLVAKPDTPPVPPDISLTFEALRLFRNSTKNDHRKISLSRGYPQGTFSRAFVEFVSNKLDLTILLEKLYDPYISDEMLLSTINSDKNIDAPGSFTQYCAKEANHPAVSITRYSLTPNDPRCHSELDDGSGCVFGIQDLRSLYGIPYLFATTMNPEIDYGAISCWARRLFNITHSPTARLQLSQYESLPAVRFAARRDKIRNDVKGFNCTHMFDKYMNV